MSLALLAALFLAHGCSAVTSDYRFQLGNSTSSPSAPEPDADPDPATGEPANKTRGRDVALGVGASVLALIVLVVVVANSVGDGPDTGDWGKCGAYCGGN